MRKSTVAVALLLLSCSVANGQFLMDMIDTTKDLGKGMLGMYQRFNHIQFSGYMQPQFQVAESKGAGGNIYAGGSFPSNTNNRFRLRRGRVRIDYAHFNKLNKPQFQFVFQFDGTEQGVNIRDFWGRYWENKWELFSFTTGMFARPFGWEINLSSSNRETPERGRMSQTLMKTERDLGFMTSLEKRNAKSGLFKYIKVDAGVFNGQGLAGSTEYDSYKDFIGQIVVKPVSLSKTVSIGGGASILQGKLLQSNKYRYTYDDSKGAMVADSSHGGGAAPRQYRGVNAQVSLKHGWGKTQWRAEYWTGTQSAGEFATETPPTTLTEPMYVRKFNGAFFYFIQDILTPNTQFLLKYDWYDPNTDVKGKEIGVPQSKLTQADICYNTWGVGVLQHLNSHVKVTLFYDIVHNELTSLPPYDVDAKDNILTLRAQFSF
ncbi:MAG TPA: hypothetical protein VLC98_14550 [Phnomibacter sp.]|nr:hypothetical protein [Phnomibacter sp.]